jgi:putative transposase
MTNHVHLLMTPQKDNGISQMMQALGRQYVRFYNYTYKRSGTLWDRFLLLQNRHTLHPCK